MARCMTHLAHFTLHKSHFTLYKSQVNTSTRQTSCAMHNLKHRLWAMIMEGYRERKSSTATGAVYMRMVSQRCTRLEQQTTKATEEHTAYTYLCIYAMSYMLYMYICCPICVWCM
jgi:hypothetical protein